MNPLFKAAPVAALLLVSAPAAQASEIGTPAHRFGLGLVGGSPSGLTGKYYPSSRHNAIEVTLGTSAGNRGRVGGLYLHGVYQWHPNLLTSEPGFELPWHVGIGGFVTDNYNTWWQDWDNGTAIGARGLLGMDFDLEDIRLQISGNIGLNLGIHSTWGLVYDPSISIAVRYFF